MRRTSRLAAISGVLFLIAACGGAAPAVSLAPGQTVVPAQSIAVPTVPPGGVNALCAGLATFSLQTPQPSFAQDTELNAKFPTQIDGQPVTDVQSSYYVQALCYYGRADTIQQLSQSLGGGSNLAQMSFGSGDATVDDESLTLDALRIPGTDANQVVQHLDQFFIAFGADPSAFAGNTITQSNIGGKNAYLITDQDGKVTYVYASGDTLWSVDGTESQAAKVFAALS